MHNKEEIEALKAYLRALPQLSRGDRGKRVERARKSFDYFIKTYFPHHAEGDGEEQSRFRRYIRTRFETLKSRHKKIEIFAYRGAAKSTLLSRLYVLYALAKEETRFTVLISDTIDVAKGNLEFIKAEIEANKNFAFDFDIAPSETWSEEQITLKVGKRLCKVKAYGSGKRIRGANFLGHRPDLIILDDIENDENVQSKTQRDKLYEWFKKAILKLPDRKRPYTLIVIGTVLHHDSVLSRIAKRKDFIHKHFPLVLAFPTHMEAWEKLAAMPMSQARARYEAKRTYYDKGAELDDEGLDLFEVMMEYFEDIDSFMSELQNTPITKEKLIFSHYRTYEGKMPPCDAYYIGVDPSLGKSKKSDYFGLGYLGYNATHKTFYTAIKGYKIPAIEMVGRIIDLYIRLAQSKKPVIVAIETVAFQEFYKDTLIREAKARGLHIPVKTYRNTSPKQLRIEAMAPLVKEGTILVSKEDYLLIEELETYPKAPHDDLLDAMEMAYRAYSGIAIADLLAMRRAVENSRYKFTKARSRYV